MKHKILALFAFSIIASSAHGITRSQAIKLIKSTYIGGTSDNKRNSMCSGLRTYPTERLKLLEGTGVGQAFETAYKMDLTEACKRKAGAPAPTRMDRITTFIQTEMPVHTDWTLYEMIRRHGERPANFSATELTKLKTFYELHRKFNHLSATPVGPNVAPKPKPKRLSSNELSRIVDKIEDRIKNGSTENVEQIIRTLGKNPARFNPDDMTVCRLAYELAITIRDTARAAANNSDIDQLDGAGLQGWRNWITVELKDGIANGSNVNNIDLKLNKRGLNPHDLAILKDFARQERVRLAPPALPTTPRPTKPTPVGGSTTTLNKGEKARLAGLADEMRTLYEYAEKKGQTPNRSIIFKQLNIDPRSTSSALIVALEEKWKILEDGEEEDWDED